MRKILLGSLVLLLFSLSIVLFEISCKKEIAAQQSNNCDETATVNFTVNFPSDFPPSTSTKDNFIMISNIYLNPSSNFYLETFFTFNDVGSATKKVYTFKNIAPGNYDYSSYIRNSNNLLKHINNVNVNLEAGKTYDFTINSADFQ